MNVPAILVARMAVTSQVVGIIVLLEFAVLFDDPHDLRSDIRPQDGRSDRGVIGRRDDVADVVRSQMEPGIPAKFLDFPKARYGLYQMDEVLLDGRRVGISTDAGYIAYDQLYMSLATLDADIADGEVVEVVWGEDPISQKHSVDAQHRQVRIRATVAPAPYHEYARTVYRADD